jgi:hypothetical protein
MARWNRVQRPALPGTGKMVTACSTRSNKQVGQHVVEAVRVRWLHSRLSSPICKPDNTSDLAGPIKFRACAKFVLPLAEPLPPAALGAPQRRPDRRHFNLGPAKTPPANDNHVVEI